MGLARRAAQHAHQAWDEAEHPTLTPPAEPDAPATRRQPDPNLTFARLATAIRCAVKLEAQIHADAFNTAHAPLPPDLDVKAILAAITKSELSHALHDVTGHAEDRANLHQDIEHTVEETLAAYPDDPLPTLFARACQTLGIQPDLIPPACIRDG